MLCAFCRQPVLPSEASERMAGRGPDEMRAHVRCLPATAKPREFREQVSFDDRSPTDEKKLRERELREGE